jgi:hypothetical protein
MHHSIKQFLARLSYRYCWETIGMGDAFRERFTLRFVARTLARLKHAAKLGPNVLAYGSRESLLGQTGSTSSISPSP